jgi:ribosomal protein S18
MEQQSNQSEIRYLTPPTVDVKKKKYCRFKKNGIKYIDYKDPEFLKKFLNEQGKILAASYHRYFFEVPTQNCESCEESSPLGIAPIRNRFDEIRRTKEWKLF